MSMLWSLRKEEFSAIGGGGGLSAASGPTSIQQNKAKILYYLISTRDCVVVSRSVCFPVSDHDIYLKTG